MKTPKPQKLPSGKFRMQYRKRGLSVSITKPTAAECIAEWLAIDTAQKRPDMPKSELTLAAAADRYLTKYDGILADSTIRGYYTMKKNRFQSLMPLRLAYITADEWEAAIKLESRKVSAKTVKNSWGFITAVMNEFQIQIPRIKLPKVQTDEHPFLDPDEIKIFLAEIEGKPVELAALLGLHSMRRSEILAVTDKTVDIKKGMIHVRGAVTFDKNQKLHFSPLNKTDAGRRDIPIMIPRLTELLTSMKITGNLVTCNPNTIYSRVNAACRSAGLDEIGTHGLRHTFASLCCELGIPEESTMRWGGWKDYQTVHKIYTHVKQSQQNKHAEKIKEFFQK